jgi:hypothetical protein
MSHGENNTKESTSNLKKALINTTLKASKAQQHSGMNIHKGLALHTLSYGMKAGQLKKDKTKITATEIKFMWRKAKHSWICNKINDILRN